MPVNSRIPGLKDSSAQQRRTVIAERTGLSDLDVAVFDPGQGLGIDQADHMIENVVGVMAIPVGVATNFTVNGRDYLVPMATEEPSVVAAASNAARMARVHGGFHTSSTDPVMQAQIQILDCPDPETSRLRVLEHARRSWNWPMPRIRCWSDSAAAHATSRCDSSRRAPACTWWCTSTSTCAMPWAPTPSTPWPRPSRRGSARSPAGVRCCGS